MIKGRAAVLLVVLVVIGVGFSARNARCAKPLPPVRELVLRQPLEHAVAAGPSFGERVHVLVPEGCPPDAPVFFILGAELPQSPDRLRDAYRCYGEPKGVIFVQAEHRGYGESLSEEPDQSVPSYVRIAEVLADYRAVQVHLSQEFTGPWLVAGYSYGGSLALWYAAEHPEGVRAVLASSAAVDFPKKTEELERYVRRYYGESCYARLKAHVAALRPREIGDEIWRRRELLRGIAGAIPQFPSKARYKPLVQLLSLLPTGAFTASVGWLEEKLNGGEGARRVRDGSARRVSREQALNGLYYDRVWRYQQCTETGLFHFSGEEPGIFPSFEEARELCRLLYGRDPEGAALGRPAPRELLDRLPVPVVYVEGGEDPSAGVLHDPKHVIPNGAYVYVPEGRHCPDRTQRGEGRRVFSELLRVAGLSGSGP